MRPRLVLLVLFSLTAGDALAAQDRYGPSPEGLRGRTDGASARPLLTWASREAQLRGRQTAAPAPAQRPTPSVAARQNIPAVQTDRPPTAALIPPPAAPDPARMARLYGAQGRGAAQPGAYAPQIPRRYSVGREFGVQPDPIAMPAPSILAFGPEVGATFAAQNERKDVEDTLVSPADQDQIEQAEQDDARRETRQRARDRASADKKK